jgi:hypothetical protein
VACQVLSIFPYYLIKGMIFGKRFIEHEVCGLIFSTTSLKHLLFQEELRDI